MLVKISGTDWCLGLVLLILFLLVASLRKEPRESEYGESSTVQCSERVQCGAV